jgi:hypothetical protein
MDSLNMQYTEFNHLLIEKLSNSLPVELALNHFGSFTHSVQIYNKSEYSVSLLLKKENLSMEKLSITGEQQTHDGFFGKNKYSPQT